MNKCLSFAFILCFIIGYTACRAQTQIDTCIVKLQSANFDEVFRARNIMLLRYQEESVPKLISLLKDTSYVKLTNTADLIYPGSKKFYGHGWVVNYDIDWVSVRAAWVLEGITFQDFGYLSRSPIDEKSLMALHQQDYQNYIKKGYHKVNYQDTTAKGRLIKYRLLLAFKVNTWWESNKSNWSRLKALKEALASHNEHRESLALQYLRFGNNFESKTESMVRTSYYPQLKDLVIQVLRNKDSESEQAGYLLKEMEGMKN